MAEPPKENQERRLEDYLDGYFVRQLKEGGDSVIPDANFALLAASKAHEQAYDISTPDHYGFFTKNLIDQLKRKRGHITYHQLIDQTRATLRQTDGAKRNQTPQLYIYGDKESDAIFLDHRATERPEERYSVYYYEGKWRIELGLLYELTFGITFRNQALELYHRDQLIGTARPGEITLHHCILEPEFDANPRLIYEARLSTDMNLRLQVKATGDEAMGNEFIEWWNSQPATADWFSWENEQAPFQIDFQPSTRNSNSKVTLSQGKRKLWSGSEIESQILSNQIKMHVIDSLRQLAHWANIRDLNNPYVNLKEEEVQITLMRTGEGEEGLIPVDNFNLPFSSRDRDADRFYLKLESQVSKTFYYLVFYLDADFNVSIMAKGELAPKQPLIVEPISLKRRSAGEYHLKVLFDSQPFEADSLQQSTSEWINSEELY